MGAASCLLATPPPPPSPSNTRAGCRTSCCCCVRVQARSCFVSCCACAATRRPHPSCPGCPAGGAHAGGAQQAEGGDDDEADDDGPFLEDQLAQVFQQHRRLSDLASEALKVNIDCGACLCRPSPQATWPGKRSWQASRGRQTCGGLCQPLPSVPHYLHRRVMRVHASCALQVQVQLTRCNAPCHCIRARQSGARGGPRG